MQITTKAIVLSAIKYGDTSLVVKAFTASSGLKSYLIRGVLTSKKGKLKSAHFQPLMQLELVAYHKNKGALESIREARINYPYTSIHTQISKNAIALFLAETLGNCIHEEEQNIGLFNFLETALKWLDSHDKIANFHIYFLLELAKYLGIYPDVDGVGSSHFDLIEGEFIENSSGNPVLTGQMLNYFTSFLGINFDDIHTVKMKKEDRQELLQNLILYFEVHLHGFRKPRSLAILNEVFN